LPFRPRYSLFAITCHNLRNHKPLR
jgi:hypothetical protein